MSLNILSILVFIHIFFWVAWKKDKLAVIDIAWGLGFVMVAIVGYLQNYPSGPKGLLLAMVAAWGLRLAWHITTRSMGKGEDPRYQEMRDQWGAHYIKEAYKKVFLAQGAAMFVISLPVQLGMSSDLERFGMKQILGLVVWGAGFFLEIYSDRHLEKFKKDPENKGKICMSGPWAFVRFPNYLGEMMIWWGVYIYIFGFWTAWTIVGPLAITLSLLKVTGIPPIERKYMKRADYREYASRVPRIFPFIKSRVTVEQHGS